MLDLIWECQVSTLDGNTVITCPSIQNLTLTGTDSTGKNPFWGSALQSTIGGAVAQTRLDDMATRILASWYLLKQDSNYPSISVTAKGGGSGKNVQGNHSTTARAVARDGIVLLKNSGNILPLQKPKSIAIIGSAAVANPKGINSCVDFGCNEGTLAQGWGSGTATLPVSWKPNIDLRTFRCYFDVNCYI
jgi:beta-glucosidase